MSTKPDPVREKDNPRITPAKSWRSCVLVTAICIAFAFILLFTVPKAAQHFAEFGTDLPAITTFVIQCRFMIAVFFTLLASAMIAKEVILNPKHLKLTSILNVLMSLFAGFVIGLITVSIALPLFKLYQAVQ